MAKRKKTNLNPLTYRLLEDRCFEWWNVEKDKRAGGRFWKEDFANFADVEAWDFEKTILVQICSAEGGGFAARRRKILSETRAYVWVCGPGREIWIHGWRKKDGKWICREEEIREEHFIEFYEERRAAGGS